MGKILLSYFSLFCNISERLRSEQSLKIRFFGKATFSHTGNQGPLR